MHAFDLMRGLLPVDNTEQAVRSFREQLRDLADDYGHAPLPSDQFN
jgi:hypothetical protein